MRHGSRFLAVLMVLLVLVAGTVPAPVAATHEECSETDEFFWVLLFFLDVNENCDSAELSQQLTELEADQVNATETEIYNTGQQTKADSEQYLTVMGNYLNDSRTVAMSKAEAAAIEAIDANKTRSEVKTAAANAVQDYYTVKQMNLADQYGVAVQTVATMENTSDLAGLSENFVKPTQYLDNPDADYPRIGTAHESSDGALPLTASGTVTLVNGSSYGSTELVIGSTYTDPGTAHMNDQVGVEDVEYFIDYSTDDEKGRAIEVAAISGQTSFEALNFTDYGNQWADIQTKSTQVEANAQAYASSLYNESQSGTLNTSTYVSPSTLAQEYSTDYNSTGYYSYAVAYSAAAGFSVPDMNVSAVMTIQTGTGQYEGLIMSQTAPNNDTWEVGVTYDAATIQGKQFVATSDGNGVVELTGQFTITEMLDEDGEAVQNTTTQQITYDVSNASTSYAALQEDIRALQQEIYEEEQSGLTGPGGGSGGGLGNMGLIAVGIIAIAGVAALVSSSGGSGRRRRR